MFTLATTGVSNGTVLPYVLSGTGITAADLIGGALAGNVTVNNNTATITVPLANDAQTEGDETLTASISGTLDGLQIVGGTLSQTYDNNEYGNGTHT